MSHMVQIKEWGEITLSQWYACTHSNCFHNERFKEQKRTWEFGLVLSQSGQHYTNIWLIARANSPHCEWVRMKRTAAG